MTGREWRQVGQDRLAYEGFHRIWQRTYELPDGTLAQWDMQGVPPTVSVLALTPDREEAVLVRQFRTGPGRLVVSLPGGLVDAGEEVATAAARELREETGFACSHVEVVGATQAPNAVNPRWSAIAYGCVPDGEQRLDELEDIEVLTWPVTRLREELRTGSLGTTEQTYLALDHLGLL
ncbi:NUDIX hydrolase [Nocardioidaceae bacterium]|nr:NUDIX hydrolase [Nocardioidaceae bacterium]